MIKFCAWGMRVSIIYYLYSCQRLLGGVCNKKWGNEEKDGGILG